MRIARNRRKTHRKICFGRRAATSHSGFPRNSRDLFRQLKTFAPYPQSDGKSEQ